MILLSISTHTCRASGPSSSETSAGRDIVEIENDKLREIQQTFNSLNERNVADNLTCERALIIIERALALYDSIQDLRFRRRAIENITRMKQLKQIIVSNREGNCENTILRQRKPESVERFARYENLYNYVVKLGREHADYCLFVLSRNLSEVIDMMTKPGKEMLESMEEFRNYYATRHFLDSQSSTPRSFPWRGQNIDEIVVSTLFDYMDSKYPILLQPRETIEQQKTKFRKYFKTFRQGSKSAFCKPIMDTLVLKFYEKLELLFLMDPGLNNKMNIPTDNWLSLMIICKRITFIGQDRLFSRYLASRYNIEQLENELLDTSPHPRRLATWESLQKLDILRELSRTSPMINVSVNRLLAASVVQREKCSTGQLRAQSTLYRNLSNYPNLVDYLNEMLRRQWALCKAIFETTLVHTYVKIDISHRTKVTDLRHNIEKFLGPPSEEREVWQLNEPRKSNLIRRGLLDYIITRFGCDIETVEDLRVKVDSELRPVCKSVQKQLLLYHEKFEQLLQFEQDFTDVTDSWMSAFVICDHCMAESFNWNDTFNDLRSSRNISTQIAPGSREVNLIGNCVPFRRE